MSPEYGAEFRQVNTGILAFVENVAVSLRILSVFYKDDYCAHNNPIH
jgi:hypothetical protein